MRTQVLKRSHRKSSASFGGPNAPPSAKRRKFANEYLTTPESVSTLTPPVHEDNDFDLPQLDELVLDIDPDQHFEFQEFAGSTLGMCACNIQQQM